MLDKRIVELSVQVGNVIKTYKDLYIKATGMKYANANQNTCTVNIYNLNKDSRNEILTSTSPFNNDNIQKKLTLYAGRESTGKFLVYTGDITTSSLTQPPDISVELKNATANFKKGDIIPRNSASTASIKQISENIAADLNLNLNFEATDKNISNYNFSGGALKQVDKINEFGDYNAYVDDDFLIVKNRYAPLNNSITIVNKNSGMIGIPELSEQGIKVKFLITQNVRLGGIVRVKSELYPQSSGDYMIYQLGFEIANRDTPFYWVACGKRL